MPSVSCLHFLLFTETKRVAHASHKIPLMHRDRPWSHGKVRLRRAAQTCFLPQVTGELGCLLSNCQDVFPPLGKVLGGGWRRLLGDTLEQPQTQPEGQQSGAVGGCRAEKPRSWGRGHRTAQADGNSSSLLHPSATRDPFPTGNQGSNSHPSRFCRDRLPLPPETKHCTDQSRGQDAVWGLWIPQNSQVQKHGGCDSGVGVLGVLSPQPQEVLPSPCLMPPDFGGGPGWKVLLLRRSRKYLAPVFCISALGSGACLPTCRREQD